jgi:hypothetical protein
MSSFHLEYDLLREEFPSAPHGKLAALALCSETVARPADALAVSRYLSREGVDCHTAYALAGPIVLSEIVFAYGGIFSFTLTGEPAFVVIVNDEDAETPVDLVAWSASDPRRFGVYFGDAGVLGADQVLNQASYFRGGLLACHRTPLAWLRAGCRGCIVLRPANARTLLARRLGPILAEDLRHGSWLLRNLAPTLVESDVFVPTPRKNRASAVA